MTQSPPGPGPDDPLWELVPLGAYGVPTGPDQPLMRRKWATLRRLFRARDEEAQAPVKAEAELRTLPGARLENLVPPSTGPRRPRPSIAPSVTGPNRAVCIS